LSNARQQTGLAFGESLSGGLRATLGVAVSRLVSLLRVGSVEGRRGRMNAKAQRTFAPTPRVLHVVPALFDADDGIVGGAERYAVELARHMARETPTTVGRFGGCARRAQIERQSIRS